MWPYGYVSVWQMVLGLYGPRGGGGLLGLGNGTDCGPTAPERWLSRPKMAKKRGGGGGCPLIIFYNRGLSEYLTVSNNNKNPIFHIK